MTNNKSVTDGPASLDLLEEAPPCFASIEQVSVRQNVILNKFHLDFPSNSVIAIMGPSGSGKTTLMSLLTDNVPSGVTAKADLVSLPGDMAMVPQDDRLHGFFTCRSYLQHYARLAGLAQGAGEARMDELLKKLGLVEQAEKGTIVGDLFIKGLSGGQKRRLSVALEALSCPQHFFLDEPTSGLDAESALQVMEFLHDYAREAKGRRVFLTIHQPSTFLWKQIDHVVLLSKGKLMYQGSRQQMEEFFSSAGCPTPMGWNPADHYVTVVNDEFREHKLSVEEWSRRFNEWVPRNSLKANVSHSMNMSKLKEVQTMHRMSNPLGIAGELTYRYWLNIFFNPGILMTRVAMYIMLALMCGMLFWDLGERNDLESVNSRIALSFYCVAFFVFMSVAVLPFTVMERDIVDKEVANKYYHPGYYQLSQAISSIPSAGLLAFLTTLIIITMTKMNDPLWYFINMFLALLVAEALAQFVSHVVPHFVIGMAALAGMYGFFMLLEGFMILPSDFPDYLYWLHPVALHTYAFRTAMVTEFGDGQEFTGTGESMKNGHAVLKFYEIENVNRAHDMYTLVGYCLFVHLLSVVVLHLRYVLFRAKVQPKSNSVVDSTRNRDDYSLEDVKEVSDEEVATF